ncbi:hypothetical protein Misp01_53040 [Microtetraspora sp. NBRC 13810]|uniref:serine/threonine-protein kinase n=1 Tax=Microtetraspora sp. NBRC 13810 TaxID=3030990 RepID=UPI002557BCD5|nr:serine/threonine-protein kinase [Microtetraspora sp. NBRC 13810]GLW10175.1 hypothetical protein Misp01_53040 [Microtetraspora sp. NBRC 13810]
MGQPLIDGDPQRLGDYWLAGRLGAGGQGVVYEAYDPGGRRVAVKVLYGDAASDPDLRNRLTRETTAAQRVASFCTARVLHADLGADRPYIVSEYVEGPTLRGAIAGGRRFDGGDLHRLATAIATALTAIHEAGVVHRDLKPDNVLLGPDGPRVIDFGVARTLEMSLTATGMAAGTPTYMAPEVFTGQRAGMPADVFAWGAIVLFAATGEDPFRAETLGAVMHRVLSVAPDLGPLPPSLRDLVGAALAKEPTARPTAPELLLALLSSEAGLDTPRLLAEGTRKAGGVGAAGTVDPALGTIAEDSYASLAPADREIVPEIFLRLVTVSDDGDLVARRAPREELLGGRPAQEAESVERVLRAFAYLVSDGEEVAFSRPAAPHAWPRLRAWIAADREGLAAHRDIAVAARRWHRQGRKDADLLHGSGLDGALHWAATLRRNITLTPVERDFLDQSAALTRRRARRNRLVLVTMVILLVAALVAGGIAVWQGQVVSVQRNEAEAGRLAGVADGLRTTDPVQAMLLSVAAWRLSPVAEARQALTGSITQPELRAFSDPAAQATRVLSRDGRILVSVGDDAARAWDVRTGAPAGGVPNLGTEGSRVLAAALNGSGRVLAVATARHGIRLWDLRAGKQLDGSYPIDPAGGTLDFRITFGESEDVLVVARGQGETAWNTRTGKVTGTGTCCGALPVPDGTGVISANLDGGLSRTALPSGRLTTPVKACDGCVLAISRDGGTIAAGTEDVIILYDAGTGAEKFRLEQWNGGGSGGTPTLRFSRDGTLIASVAENSVRIWRLDDTNTLLMDHAISATAPQAAFDPDGQALRYLSGDTVVTLDLSRLAGAGGWNSLSPDGRLIAGRVPATGEIRLVETDGWRSAGPSPGTVTGSLGIFSSAFSQDGGLLAYTGRTIDDTDITVWDTRTATRRALLTGGHTSWPDRMRFSSDGRLLASLASHETERGVGFRVVLWDLRDGRARWQLDREHASDIAFTPDGRSLVVYGDEIRLADLATGELGGPAVLGEDSRAVRIATGGALYAPGDADGRLTVWEPGAAGPRELTLRGSTRDITDLALTPGGDLLATMRGTGEDTEVTLWDTADGRPLGRPVTESVARVTALAFSPDGRRLLTLDGNDLPTSRLVTPEALTAAVCARAGRDLSEQEWQAHLPGVPYRPVCRS